MSQQQIFSTLEHEEITLLSVSTKSTQPCTISSIRPYVPLKHSVSLSACSPDTHTPGPRSLPDVCPEAFTAITAAQHWVTLCPQAPSPQTEHTCINLTIKGLTQSARKQGGCSCVAAVTESHHSVQHNYACLVHRWLSWATRLS